MTNQDPRNRGALVFEDDMPGYELAADALTFLFRIRHEGRKLDVYPTLRPYRNARVIELLREREAYFEPARDEEDAHDLKRGSFKLDRDFFNEHVVSVTLGGKTLTSEQLEKLDAVYNFKVNVVNKGYNGIAADLTEEDDDPDREVDLDAILGAPIKRSLQYFLLADTAGKEHRIDLAHVFRFPTAADSNRWEQARRIRHGRKDTRKVTFNYDALHQLYDGMIQSADGFRFHGEPCTEANREGREGWCEAMPFLFKFFALIQLFSEAERKNG